MSERDEAAEMAVRDAITTLITSGARAYSVNVPFAAERSLVAKSGRTLNFAEANERITQAVIGMTKRGELEAPFEAHVDWKLLR
jgi:hypothetical protein